MPVLRQNIWPQLCSCFKKLCFILDQKENTFNNISNNLTILLSYLLGSNYTCPKYGCSYIQFMYAPKRSNSTDCTIAASFMITNIQVILIRIYIDNWIAYFIEINRAKAMLMYKCIKQVFKVGLQKYTLSSDCSLHRKV